MASYGGIAETQYLIARLIVDPSGASGPLKALNAQLSGMGRGFAALGTAASGSVKFLERTTLATVGAIALLENQFIKVQDAQAALARTITGESAPAVAKLNKQILELSKEVPLAVTELYRIAEVIGTTGIAADSIDELTRVVAQLAATTDLSADEAAIGMARLLTIFGDVDDAGKILAGTAEGLGSAITKASLDFASSDQDILRATLRFAALGKQMGLTKGEILALSALGTGLGQQPEAFGGSMQRLLQIFLKLTGEYDKLTKKQKEALTGTDKLAQIAKVAGLTEAQFAKGINTAPFETITKFLDGLKELSAAQQATLFGGDAPFPSLVRGQQSIQNLTERIDKLKLAGKDLDSTFKRGTFLEDVFAVRTDTLSKKLQLLWNAVTRAGVAFGDAFNEELGDAIGRITEAIDRSLPSIEKFGRQVAQWFRNINWDAAGETVKNFFGIFKFGFDIVRQLPTELLGVIALFKTLQALTGGAFASLASTGIKIVFDQVFARGAPGNPLFVWVENQLGLGGAGGKGGAGSQLAMLGVLGVLAANVAVIPEAFHGVETAVKGFVAGTRTAVFNGIKDILGAGRFNPFMSGIVPLFDMIISKYQTLLAPPLGLKPDQQPFGSDLAALNAKAAAQYQAGMRDDLISTTMLLDAAETFSSATKKFLDGLKPRHREGEVGKSKQSAEFRFLERVDPSKTDKITTALADLIEHYKDKPIGTKGHERGFIEPAFKGILPDLKQALKAAMASGDQGAVGRLVDQLKGLKEIGIHLPPGLRRLIKAAGDNTETNKETKQAVQKVKSAVTDASDRIENVTAAIRRKKLAVSVTPKWSANVRAPSVRVTPIVRVTIGARTITRYVRGVTSYGPGIVLMQTGTGAAYYSGGGGP